MNNEYFLKILKYLKDYLSLIIIIPAILGGLWQLAELISISPSFVRFFSVTQVASDGLLIIVFSLVVILTFYLTYLFYRIFKYCFSFLFSKVIFKFREKRAFKLFSGITFFILGLFFLLLYYVNYKFYAFPLLEHEDHKIYPDGSEEFSVINPFEMNEFLFFIVATIITSLIISYFISKGLYNFGVNNNKIKRLQFYSLFAFNIIIFTSVFKIFHTVFYLPKNLRNEENVTSAFMQTEDVDVKILYFNDKYIFVNCYYYGEDIDIGNDKNVLYIVKFDEFFNEKNRDEFFKWFVEKNRAK